MKLADVPTTNLRIVVTLGLEIATGAVYLGLAVARLFHLDANVWTPSEVWLGFLAVMSGLDWVQFRTKRQTDFRQPHNGGSTPNDRERQAVP